MKMNLLRFIGAQSVDFPIIGADPSGPFVLKSVEGLGPTEINVRLTRSVLEKAIYQGKSAGLRQVTALVQLQPDWNEGQTPEELRTTLYSLLTPRYGNMVRMEIVYDGVVQGYAQGHISKMEPALFTKDPAVMLTLDCDYAYILGPSIVTQEPVQTTVGAIADDPATTTVNEYNPGVRAFDVINEGTAPAGFLAGFNLMANVGTTLTLSDENPQGQKMQIDGIDWLAGDIFVIDTRPGYRGLWRGAGGGALVSVLNNMNAGVSEWIHLYGGNNRLVLNVSAFDWNPTYKFSHQPAFWGV